MLFLWLWNITILLRVLWEKLATSKLWLPIASDLWLRLHGSLSPHAWYILRFFIGILQTYSFKTSITITLLVVSRHNPGGILHFFVIFSYFRDWGVFVVCARLAGSQSLGRIDSNDRYRILVSHYSAIGDAISYDALYCAIGFRGKLFLRYPPC